jgi:Family of unknown function (DUF5670)
MPSGTVTVKSLVRGPNGRKLLANPEPPEAGMLVFAIVLLVAWFLGWAVFHVAGALIHLLLLVAVVVFIYRLITGRRTV